MMDPPSDDYYTELPARIGDALEPWQFEKAQVLFGVCDHLVPR